MLYENLLQCVKNAGELYSDNSALVYQDTVYTYRTLIREAEKWAVTLLNSTKKNRLHRVAIYSYRSPTSYIGTVAALMTGAAFIPLNPRLPTERNINILKQSQPDAIITDSVSLKELLNISSKIDLPAHILLTDSQAATSLDSELKFIKPDDGLSETIINFPKIAANDLAYILFTSGSTGQPKGVPITHANACSFLKYNQEKYKITPLDRFSQTFEQTFDLSVFDLFMAWCHGASLYAMRPIDLLSPSKYINENKITIWFSVPTVISLLRKQNFLNTDCFPTLKLSLFCGEPLLESDLAAWAAAAPNSICENLYGPTELTIACSAYRWQRDKKNTSHNGILSIGKLYEPLDYILVNEHGNIDPDEGELCVAGNQRFHDYLNTSGDKQSYFIEIMDENNATCIYYRTGDQVKKDVEGNMLYLGRLDQQIKINGYRIELGEIESVLKTIPGVERALVFYLNSDSSDTKKLVSFVVGTSSVDDILVHAKRLLPLYMIPSEVKIGKTLPLNSNGKIDRKYIATSFMQSDNKEKGLKDAIIQ